MTKFILLVLVLALVFWYLARKPGKAADNQGGTRSDPVERMVVCAHCRLNVPESESVGSAGHYYCCDEHAKSGPQDNG